MFFKIFLVTLLSFCCFEKAYSQQDECVPNALLILLIAPNATLYWDTHEREPCEITEYLVEAVGDKGDSHVVTTQEKYVDLSFLEVCEEWRFTVTAISHSTKGFPRTMTTYIPLPPEADLSLRYFNVTQKEGRDVLLEWDLNDLTHGDCTLQYRITIEDDETGVIDDIYVQGNSVDLTLLSPCVEYEIGIRAINRAFPTVEGPLRWTTFEMPAQPQVSPILQDASATATSINLVWVLEAGTNRCPLKALHLESNNNFNISIPLLNSQDPEPVSVNLQSLQPDSMYYIRVKVENNGGLSRPAQIGVQTLPLSSD